MINGLAQLTNALELNLSYSCAKAEKITQMPDKATGYLTRKVNCTMRSMDGFSIDPTGLSGASKSSLCSPLVCRSHRKTQSKLNPALPIEYHLCTICHKPMVSPAPLSSRASPSRIAGASRSCSLSHRARNM